MLKPCLPHSLARSMCRKPLDAEPTPSMAAAGGVAETPAVQIPGRVGFSQAIQKNLMLNSEGAADARSTPSPPRRTTSA